MFIEGQYVDIKKVLHAWYKNNNICFVLEGCAGSYLIADVSYDEWRKFAEALKFKDI